MAECPHRSILRRVADKGTPITAMYCLICGKALKRDYQARAWSSWARSWKLLEEKSSEQPRKNPHG